MLSGGMPIDDRPQVECMDLDSTENVQLPFIDDDAAPEDDLDDDEANEQAEMTIATNGRSEFDFGGPCMIQFCFMWLGSSCEYRDAVWWYANRRIH